MTLSEKLRLCLADIPARTVAEFAGVDIKTAARWCHSVGRPSATKLFNLAKNLNISMHWLLDDNLDGDPQPMDPTRPVLQIVMDGLRDELKYVAPTTLPQSITRRYECTKCGKPVSPSQVVVDDQPVRYTDAQNGFAVIRQFYCDHCNCIIGWIETAKQNGEPLGGLISGPTICNNHAEVQAFLKHHPDATGVKQL